MGRTPVTKVYYTLALLMLGCSQQATSRVSLGVQLLSDLETGKDFASIEVEVEGAEGKRRAGALAEPLAYLEPQRVADFRGLAPNAARRVTLRLRDESGKEVIARVVKLDHRVSSTRTIVITRSCLDVRCKDGAQTSCLGGDCVQEACADGTEAECTGRKGMCASDEDCSARDCQQSRCMLNNCLVVETAACDGGAPGADGGAADAGLADAAADDAGAGDGIDAGTGGADCDGSLCQLDAACARHSFKQHVYWLCQRARPYADARALCEAGGVSLLVIDNAEENAFVTTLIQRATGVTDRRGAHYIGLDDNAQEGNFAWVDGSPLDYVNWEMGAPSNATNNQCGSENCAAIWANGSWNDSCCLGAFPFLCESK